MSEIRHIMSDLKEKWKQLSRDSSFKGMYVLLLWYLIGIDQFYDRYLSIIFCHLHVTNSRCAHMLIKLRNQTPNLSFGKIKFYIFHVYMYFDYASPQVYDTDTAKITASILLPLVMTC